LFFHLLLSFRFSLFMSFALSLSLPSFSSFLPSFIFSLTHCCLRYFSFPFSLRSFTFPICFLLSISLYIFPSLYFLSQEIHGFILLFHVFLQTWLRLLINYKTVRQEWRGNLKQ
jgi:hypothetical protein